MGASSWVYLDVEKIIQATDKALLLQLVDGRQHWVPRSVICDGDDYEQGDEDVTISVAVWFAEKEGIEGDES